MSYGEEQKKEIATIKERDIKINLSDADVQRIWKKAGSVGLTVSELLENFIGDLVYGTYSNGSDERIFANEWFDRCGFKMFSNKTFLIYLIDSPFDDVESTMELWDDIKNVKEELASAEAHKDEFTVDDIEGMEEDLAYWNEQLNNIYSEFQDWAKGEQIGTQEEEMGRVLKWNEQMRLMKMNT